MEIFPCLACGSEVGYECSSYHCSEERQWEEKVGFGSVSRKCMQPRHKMLLIMTQESITINFRPKTSPEDSPITSTN
jgi:hypothetical protein